MDEADKIEAPVAMPPVVRRIATLLLGLPGVILWIGGLFGVMIFTASSIAGSPADRLSNVASLGVSLASILFGYAMVATSYWLNGSHHYRMPGHRLPAYVAMEILELLLAAGSVGISIVSLISLSSGDPASPPLWILLSVSGFILLGLSMRLRIKLGNRWRDELLAGPEGTKARYK